MIKLCPVVEQVSPRVATQHVQQHKISAGLPQRAVGLHVPLEMRALTLRAEQKQEGAGSWR